MATSKRKSLIIILFPYLFIHDKEGIEVEGMKILPSYTENVNKEKPKVKDQLLTIAKLFRFGRDNQIFQWCYTIAHIDSPIQWEELLFKLNKLSHVIRYSKLRDHRENARFEQFNHFTFEITERQTKKDKELSFYQGLLNGQSFYNFYLKDGVVTNPYTPNEELHPLLMTKDEVTENDYFNAFYKYPRHFLFNNGEDKKILRSMEWFNRSFSHNARGVDLSEAVLNLETALEALLRPEDENQGVRAQVKTALRSLLGQSQQVSLWFDTFWKLRSAIVHGGVVPASFMYVHPESREKKGHRHHLTIAREVFVGSLDAILKIRASFPLFGFDEKLVSNEIRVIEAIKLLKKFKNKGSELNYQNNTFEFISNLRSDDVSASKQDVKELGILFLPLVKDDLEKNESGEKTKEVIEKIDEVLKWKGSDLGDLALLYSNLEEMYSPFYFKDVAPIIHILALRGAAYNLFSFATWRLLTIY